MSSYKDKDLPLLNIAKLKTFMEKNKIRKSTTSLLLGYDEEYVHRLISGKIPTVYAITISQLINIINMDAFTALEFLNIKRFNQHNVRSFLHFTKLSNEDPHELINTFMKLYSDDKRAKFGDPKPASEPPPPTKPLTKTQLRRLKQLSMGKCPRCSKPIKPGYSQCEYHHNYAMEYQVKLRQKQRAELPKLKAKLKRQLAAELR